jgi:hypothetical protein
LANGAIYDLDKKRIVANPGGGTMAITQAQASAMSTLRWEQYRQSAASGLAKAGRRHNRTDAWEWIVEKQAELATAIDKGRSSTEAARFVGSAVGATPERGAAGANSGGDNVNISFPVEVIRALLDDLRRARGDNDQGESR